MSKADLHIHTHASDGIVPDEELLDFIEHETDLDVIAVTDHNTFDGVDRIQALAKEKKVRFDVIAGQEITSSEGHIVGLFLKEWIDKGMSATATVDAIHDQEGLAILAHPGREVSDEHADRLLRSVPFDGLELVGLFDYSRTNFEQWRKLNNDVYRKAEIVSTDAHTLQFFNRGWTTFPGHTADDLRGAIQKRRTKGVCHRPFTYWEKRGVEATFVWGHRADIVYFPRFAWEAVHNFQKDFLQ